MPRSAKELKDSIRVEKITTSFMVELRNPQGSKSSSFLSYSVQSEDGEGWTMDEARYVEACIAQQVVEDLYTDAFVRDQIDKGYREKRIRRIEPMYEQLKKKRGDALQEQVPDFPVSGDDSIEAPRAQS